MPPSIDDLGNIVAPRRHEDIESGRTLGWGGAGSDNSGCGYGNVGRWCQNLSPIFLGMLAAFTALCVIAGFSDSTGILIGIVLLGWLISLSLHEFGHAYVAYLAGDSSVIESGYLTLDLTKYLDPIFSIIVPTGLLLLGGVPLPGAAVYLQPQYFASKKWESYVSLAGPLANLFCAIIASCLFHIHQQLGRPLFDHKVIFGPALALLCYFQVLAALLNLLPLPPLDGWGALSPWLPESFFVKRWLANPYHRKSIMLVTFLIIFMGVQFIPGFNWAMMHLLSLLGMQRGEVREGFSRFRQAFRLRF